MATQEEPEEQFESLKHELVHVPPGAIGARLTQRELTFAVVHARPPDELAGASRRYLRPAVATAAKGKHQRKPRNPR